ISDYAKGMVTRELVEEVLRLAKGKPVIVDPKVENFDMYAGVSLVTPNNSEASLAAGIDIVDDKSLNRAAAVIKDKLGCEALLITRGEHGMSIFTGGTKKPHSIPTIAREIFDVSGAGDTVVGVFALALAAGADYKEAAVMSNLAAGIVVEKLGTATVDISELKAAVQKRLK
ncbi:MAG: bifunctional hydroxymethylpyrimidine kinase/phosphomethylpyrimidine kinase, partial [Deltaproteobacteria bacterium]|nr:bifunctional hydroxymethylpyrimidine kinase/phosphomethylpyrimidine kinase [Deltaproteobacteria bacterium]